MSAVELDAVDKNYGSVRALVGVGLSIEAGTLTRVTGPNGAGKSTLLRVVAGLTRPTRGRVTVEGSDLFRSANAGARAGVGYLGADAGLYGELSLDENLAFCARLQGVSSARVEGAIDRLDLGAVRTRPLGGLSLGFRRRAGLARLLACAPALWLLDEPWNGLDAHASRLLAEALREQRSAGGTAIVAAHAAGEHAELFDRGIELRQGQLSTA